MVILSILFFILCCVALYYAGNLVLESLSGLGRFFHWKEFIVAFFVMALAATLPNLFLAIAAVIDGVPQLSLGDVMGGNVFDMTAAIAIAVFFSKKGISAKDKTIQTSLLFTFAAAVLPLILLLDNKMSRFDGILLLTVFFGYIYWLLSKKERFKSMYLEHPVESGAKKNSAGKNILKAAVGITVLLTMAQMIVNLATGFSEQFNISLPLIGILLVSLGNCLPETYFSIAAARVDKTNMILGDIMGAVIMPGTLVLGLVALISPFSIDNPSMFAAARYFLLIAALLFLICARTDKKITKKEGVLLLMVYFAFLLAEIFVK